MALLLFIAFILSAAITLWVIPIIVKRTERYSILDMPTDRKVHTTPTSRFGGSCFFPIIVLVMCIILMIDSPMGFPLEGGIFGITNTWRMVVIVLSGAVLYATGLYDDFYGLDYKKKFVTQALSALCIVFGICYPIFGLTYQLPIILVFIIYVINAINMIDGIDGLASAISFFALLVLTICHSMLSNWFGALLGASTMGVVFVFFFYNVYSWNSKAFMGDTGSMTLGLIIAYLIVSVHTFEQKSEGGIPYYLPICISPILIPLVDVVRVVAIRLYHMQNPFLPDKNHIHHTLMKAGLTQTQTLQWLLFVSGLFIIGTWQLILFLIHK